MATAEAEREEFEPAGRAQLPEEDAGHPGPRQYVVVAVVLAVVTGMEVALFYMDFLPSPVVVGALLVLMALKFATVALWFMHLRFDSPIYKRLFLTGIVLALSVFVIVLLTFGVFIRD
jgi:cytochrome c oxidase subunit 4